MLTPSSLTETNGDEFSSVKVKRTNVPEPEFTGNKKLKAAALPLSVTAMRGPFELF